MVCNLSCAPCLLLFSLFAPHLSLNVSAFCSTTIFFWIIFGVKSDSHPLTSMPIVARRPGLRHGAALVVDQGGGTFRTGCCRIAPVRRRHCSGGIREIGGRSTRRIPLGAVTCILKKYWIENQGSLEFHENKELRQKL